MTKPSRLVPIVIVAFVTLLLVGLPLQRTGSFSTLIGFLAPTVATMAIFAIVCVGLNVQWGYTGIFNFGVVAFFMVGAYTAGIVAKAPADGEFVTYVGGFGNALGGNDWLPFIVALLAAGAAAGILGLLLAWPTLRLRDDYLAIALIGAAEVLRRVVVEETWLVNGSRGLGGFPRPLASLVAPEHYRYLFLAIVVGLLIVIYALVELGIRSPWGRVLRALREDEAAAAASGKDVRSFKVQGFVLGAIIMGIAGGLFGFQQGAIAPESFTHFFGTFIFWAMLIAGGSGNMLGAIVGTYVIWGLWSTSLQIQGYDLPEFLDGRIPHLRDMLVGLIIVAVLLINPRGLFPETAQVSRWLDERVASMRAAAKRPMS
ncbi:MAG: branched-chain amino acid ABC transporter permease [Chloroflexota bacterium]|nr:branched-chain amino acid ABC transporter permease [Chloroflexota bacterium]